MNRRDAAKVLGAVPLAGIAARLDQRPRQQEEMTEHPRIAAAVTALQDAIAYMQAAPHDFGGHKVAAIQASRAAIAQLRLAMAYRASAERRRS